MPSPAVTPTLSRHLGSIAGNGYTRDFGSELASRRPRDSLAPSIPSYDRRKPVNSTFSSWKVPSSNSPMSSRRATAVCKVLHACGCRAREHRAGISGGESDRGGLRSRISCASRSTAVAIASKSLANPAVKTSPGSFSWRTNQPCKVRHRLVDARHPVAAGGKPPRPCGQVTVRSSRSTAALQDHPSRPAGSAGSPPYPIRLGSMSFASISASTEVPNRSSDRPQGIAGFDRVLVRHVGPRSASKRVTPPWR